MTGYVLRRLGAALGLLVVISIITFVLTHVVLGDPVQLILGGQGSFATQDQFDALRTELGFDQPLYHQYVTWISGLLTGDLGDSYTLPMSVSGAISSALPVTLELAVLGTIYYVTLGVTVGLLSARRRGTRLDTVASTASTLFQAVPYFALAVALIYVGSIVLGIFPPSGYVPFTEDPLGNLHHMVLPVIAVGTPFAGVIARFTRGIVLEEMEKEHVKAARAKGVSSTRVLLNHGLRNASIPLMTTIGMNTGVLMGGAVVVEEVFAMPGIGSLLVHSILGRDLLVVQSTVLYISVVVIAVNLAVDLLHGLGDPRMRVAA